MFYDIPSNDEQRLNAQTTPDSQARLVLLSDDPPLTRSLSQRAEEIINKLESIITQDPGKRNIAPLIVHGDLIKSALCLSQSKSVAIVTGYPALFKEDFPFETDGPPGALALALFLQSLEKDVTIILDCHAGFDKAMKSIISNLTISGIIVNPIPVQIYPTIGCCTSDHSSALEFLTINGDASQPRFDHLVAIERPGKATDGQYYTMKANKIGHLVTDTDVLFEVAKNIPSVFTTGIGDGGNELGMGKVHERIKKHIPHGETIASKGASDFLITCGVSNWGGYALCFALYTLRNDFVHNHSRCQGFPLTDEEKRKLRESLPQKKQEEAILKALMEHSFKDMNNEICMSVDGLDFYEIHVPILENMMECVS